MKMKQGNLLKIVLYFGISVSVIGLLLTDVIFRKVSQYWTDHSMTGAIVSGVVLFLLAAFVVQEWIDRREARTWRRVAGVGFRSLGTGCLLITQVLLAITDLDRIDKSSVSLLADSHLRSLSNYFESQVKDLPLGFSERICMLAEDPSWVLLAHRAVLDVRTAQRDLIASWASVMLQTDDLAEVLNRSALMAEALDSEIVSPLWNASISNDGMDLDVVQPVFAPAAMNLLEKSIQEREWLNRASGVKPKEWTSPYRKHLPVSFTAPTLPSSQSDLRAELSVENADNNQVDADIHGDESD
jgi:hypothetical protein